MFDLNIVKPEVLYEEVVQAEGRVILDRADCCLDKTSFRKVVGATRENVFVVQELNEEKLKRDLERIKENGFKNQSVFLFKRIVLILFIARLISPTHIVRIIIIIMLLMQPTFVKQY